MAQTFARRAGLVLAGTGVYAGVAGLTYLYMTHGKEDQLETERKVLGENFSFVSNPERNNKYDSLAAKYDYLISTDERFMGMGILRKQLLYWHARGTVLEVAAGTGRNSSLFPSTVNRVILTDTSEKMLEQARKKLADLALETPKFATIKADGQQLAFDDNSFDTVLDTFGLCSFDDPVAVLKEMERVCKPDGKILLLEHGRCLFKSAVLVWPSSIL
jgi:methyltransferase OMS1, mitochondrial